MTDTELIAKLTLELLETRKELKAAIELREDAEERLEVFVQNHKFHLNALRESRDSLRKGQSTMGKRIDELMKERDFWRTKAGGKGFE